MTTYDAVIVGAGQSGLAAAHHLRRRGLSTAVLEAGPEPVGSWPHYYDSLTLFSPARYSSLPGLPFPAHPDHYPHRDEVVDYLRHYAAGLDADFHTDHRVTTVDHDGHRFSVATEPGATFTAPRLIAATGGFATPHQPALPGLDSFTGTVLHAGALDADGHPCHRKGIATTHPGLGHLGLEWQRSLSSASLRGVGRLAAQRRRSAPIR